MKKPAALVFLTLPTLGWAQANAAYQIDVPTLPLRAQAGFNGQLLVNDTEFLTPDGILDTLPPQQALAAPEMPLDTIEPAAGAVMEDLPTTSVPVSENTGPQGLSNETPAEDTLEDGPEIQPTLPEKALLQTE